MIEELGQQSAGELIRKIGLGTLSAMQVTNYFLDAIAADNRRLNAYVTLCDRQAKETAGQLDQQVASKSKLGPLAGLPIAIKDGICTEGVLTTACSKILSEFVPPYDATVVQKLKQAGAVILGKTNMDEFAMGSSTENSCFGPTRNPWDVNRVPGGSSGGSAVAVAAGMAAVAIGTDTGGSIRQPAAFCGLTGLKPTYGQVSRYGLIAYASSLDQIGPLAWSAEDCALVMSIIAGHDSADSTSSTRPVPDFLAELQQPLTGVRIGICVDHFHDGLDREIQLAIDDAQQILISLGAELTTVSLRHSQYAVNAYYVIAPCEASSNLARYDGVRYTNRQAATNLDQMYCRTRSQGLGAEVQRRIMLGTFALSSGYYDAYYLRASRIRRLIKDDYDRAFESCDFILGPTTPTPPFPLGCYQRNPLEMYLADAYTVSANLAGLPAISFPIGFTRQGLPIGMQLQGGRFSDARLLALAHQFQSVTTWHQHRPSRADQNG